MTIILKDFKPLPFSKILLRIVFEEGTLLPWIQRRQKLQVSHSSRLSYKNYSVIHTERKASKGSAYFFSPTTKSKQYPGSFAGLGKSNHSFIFETFHKMQIHSLHSNVRVVDLRSDTVTRPTEKMRKAMCEAAVGDDVYGEDPTVNELEEITADIFKKENALFVPTGTMGNLISILSHCWERSSAVILGDQSHIYGYEQGGIAQLGSVLPKSIPNNPDGTFNLSDVQRVYRDGSDFHYAKSSAVAIENTIFGKALPMKFMSELRTLADELQLPIHLDGARVFHAATALNIPVNQIAQNVDTINICLSKGLGAPVGSMVIGSKDFIKRARRVRKCVGGGMRQAGILAAAGLIAITEMTKRLHIDHDNALRFAKAVQGFGPDVFKVNMSNIQTNMVVFDVGSTLTAIKSANTAKQLCDSMGEATKDSPTCVQMLSFSPVTVRVVFHSGVTEDDTQTAINKLSFVVDAWTKNNRPT